MEARNLKPMTDPSQTTNDQKLFRLCKRYCNGREEHIRLLERLATNLQ